MSNVPVFVSVFGVRFGVRFGVPMFLMPVLSYPMLSGVIDVIT